MNPLLVIVTAPSDTRSRNVLYSLLLSSAALSSELTSILFIKAVEFIRMGLCRQGGPFVFYSTPSQFSGREGKTADFTFLTRFHKWQQGQVVATILQIMRLLCGFFCHYNDY